MMMRRRLACCTRDRELSFDFDEQDSKENIYLFIIIISLDLCRVHTFI